MVTAPAKTANALFTDPTIFIQEFAAGLNSLGFLQSRLHLKKKPNAADPETETDPVVSAKMYLYPVEGDDRDDKRCALSDENQVGDQSHGRRHQAD